MSNRSLRQGQPWHIRLSLRDPADNLPFDLSTASRVQLTAVVNNRAVLQATIPALDTDTGTLTLVDAVPGDVSLVVLEDELPADMPTGALRFDWDIMFGDEYEQDAEAHTGTLLWGAVTRRFDLPAA